MQKHFYYYIGYVAIKDSKYVKNSANLLCLIFSKANGYFKKINGNKFLTLVPTNKRKDIMENTKSSEVKSEIQLGE